MADPLSQDQVADLNLTHAFINTLSASYQGLYVYENVFGELSHSPERETKMQQTAQVLDKINEWWAMFKRHAPLMRHSFREEGMAGDPVKAWKLLEVVQRRLEALMQELLERGTIEALVHQPESRAMRVAAFCESAYTRWHFIQGLVAYGEILDREDVAGRWRQHLLSCQRERSEADALFAKYQKLGDRIDKEAAAFLLDISLTHPVVVARRAIDVRSVFGLLRGRFDYGDAGIPEHEVAGWQEHLSPGEAAQWRLAGMKPEQAMAWIKSGVPDALGAATFAWRGIAKEVAAKWYAEGYNGHAAAGWLHQGIEEPAQIPREA